MQPTAAFISAQRLGGRSIITPVIIAVAISTTYADNEPAIECHDLKLQNINNRQIASWDGLCLGSIIDGTTTEIRHSKETICSGCKAPKQKPIRMNLRLRLNDSKDEVLISWNIITQDTSKYNFNIPTNIQTDTSFVDAQSRAWLYITKHTETIDSAATTSREEIQ